MEKTDIYRLEQCYLYFIERKGLFAENPSGMQICTDYSPPAPAKKEAEELQDFTDFIQKKDCRQPYWITPVSV